MQCCLFESPLCSWISSAMLHQDDSSPKVLLPSLMNSRLSLWSCKQARTACPSLTVVVTSARAAPHSNKSRSPNCHSLALPLGRPRAVPCATQPHSRLANLPRLTPCQPTASRFANQEASTAFAAPQTERQTAWTCDCTTSCTWTKCHKNTMGQRCDVLLVLLMLCLRLLQADLRKPCVLRAVSTANAAAGGGRGGSYSRP